MGKQKQIAEAQEQIAEAEDSMEEDDSFFKAIDVDAGPSDSELKRKEEKGARDNKKRQDEINEKIKNGEELSCFDKLEPDKYGYFKSSEWTKCDQEERAARIEKQKQSAEAQDSMADDDSFFKAIDVDAGPSDSELKRKEEKGARENKKRQDKINEKIKNGEELSCFDKLEPDKYGMFKSSEWSKCDQEERAALQEKQKQ